MSTTYSNVMLDLETMGTSPDAAIVSIGAVAFDPLRGELGPKFYARITLDSAVAIGGIIEPDTVIWWLGQGTDARDEITHPIGQIHINSALIDFSSWIADHTVEPCLWGNGSDFDNVILRRSYERSSLTARGNTGATAATAPSSHCTRQSKCSGGAPTTTPCTTPSTRQTTLSTSSTTRGCHEQACSCGRRLARSGHPSSGRRVARHGGRDRHKNRHLNNTCTASVPRIARIRVGTHLRQALPGNAIPGKDGPAPRIYAAGPGDENAETNSPPGSAPQRSPGSSMRQSPTARACWCSPASRYGLASRAASAPKITTTRSFSHETKPHPPHADVRRHGQGIRTGRCHASSPGTRMDPQHQGQPGLLQRAGLHRVRHPRRARGWIALWQRIAEHKQLELDLQPMRLLAARLHHGTPITPDGSRAASTSSQPQNATTDAWTCSTSASSSKHNSSPTISKKWGYHHMSYQQQNKAPQRLRSARPVRTPRGNCRARPATARSVLARRANAQPAAPGTGRGL